MRKLLLPILLIILAIFSVFWYSWPQYQSTATLRAEIDDYDTALSQVNEIQQIRDRLLSRYNQLPQSSLYIMDRILPYSLERVRYLIELDQIALRSNLDVQDISFTAPPTPDQGSDDAPAAPSKPYESSRVTFSVSGPYPDVLSYLRDLERSAQLIDIVQVAVQARTEDDMQLGSPEEIGPPSGEDNTYTITGVTYWMPNEDS